MKFRLTFGANWLNFQCGGEKWGSSRLFPYLLKTCLHLGGETCQKNFLGGSDPKDFYERGACRRLKVGTNTF